MKGEGGRKPTKKKKVKIKASEGKSHSYMWLLKAIENTVLQSSEISTRRHQVCVCAGENWEICLQLCDEHEGFH